jgi:hypothetical protein
VLRALLCSLEGDRSGAAAALEAARPQLGSRQWAGARALVELAQEVPGLSRLLSLDPGPLRVSVMLHLVPVVRKGLATLRDPDAQPPLPVPPVLMRAFRARHDAPSLVALLMNPNALMEQLGKAADIHSEGLLFLARGLALAQQDHWAEAEEAFTKAAATPSVIPVRQQALFGAASCACVLAKGPPPRPEAQPRAVQRLRQVVGAGGFPPDQAALLSTMALQVKEFDLARWVIREWERQSPKDPKVLEQRAQAEFEAGAYGSAVQAVRQILDRKLAPADRKRWEGFRDRAAAELRRQARELSPPTPGSPGV